MSACHGGRCPETAVIGTSPNEFILKTLEELRGKGCAVTALVKDGREVRITESGFPVRRFSGDIGWTNVRLLLSIREIRPDLIVIAVGDQFSHMNVVKTLAFWTSFGLLGRTDVACSYSYDPGVLERLAYDGPFSSAYSFFIASLAAFGGALVFLGQSAAFTLAAAVVIAMLFRKPCAAHWKHSSRGGMQPSRGGDSWGESAAPMIIEYDYEAGWVNRPAVVTSTVLSGEAHGSYSRRITIEATGARAVSPEPSDTAKPVIMTVGGSHIFGESLTDEKTFPWMLQGSMPSFRLMNFSSPGYSNRQSLVILERKLATEKPSVVIFGFDPRCRCGTDVFHGNEPLRSLPADECPAVLSLYHNLLRSLGGRVKAETDYEKVNLGVLVRAGELCRLHSARLIVLCWGGASKGCQEILDDSGISWTLAGEPADSPEAAHAAAFRAVAQMIGEERRPLGRSGKAMAGK